jgi:hypothetical protein
MKLFILFLFISFIQSSTDEISIGQKKGGAKVWGQVCDGRGYPLTDAEIKVELNGTLIGQGMYCTLE